MIGISREIIVEEITVTIRELTVAEVRTWMAEPPVEKPDFDLVVDLLSFNGLSVDDLLRFSTLTREQAIVLTPSSLAKIAGVAKELNSHFFDHYLPALSRLREHLQTTTPSTASNTAPAI